MSSIRALFIDNLRIFLIILVVLHHLTITYCGGGGWYYVEHKAEGLSMIPYILFLVSNQSFFMGLFFLISAYFTVPSYNRKGGWRFLKDRLIRLGIPLLVFFFIINPVTIYILIKYIHNYDGSFVDLYLSGDGFGFGPMWFVETLMYFTLIYLLIRFINRRKEYATQADKALPASWKILLLAFIIGLITFVVRLRFSLGSSIPHTGLQLPYFTQYIAMLILGVYMYKNNWFEKISFKYGIRWFVFAQIIIFIVFPLFLYYGGGKVGNLDPYTGGLHWQSFVMSVLEQLLGISLMIGLIGIFRAKFSTQNRFRRALSASAYTVYIIHPLILVSITISLRNWELVSFLKLIILAPVVVFTTFAIAYLIRRIPYFDRVL